jgi:predicted DNA-binding transcriptional regulator AlpA
MSNEIIERPKDFAAALGISLATLWRRVKNEPDFPQPLTLSDQAVGFLRSERLAYIGRLVARRDARLAARQQPAQPAASVGASRPRGHVRNSAK